MCKSRIIEDDLKLLPRTIHLSLATNAKFWTFFTSLPCDPNRTFRRVPGRARKRYFFSHSVAILELWPAKLRHTKPKCNKIINKNVPNLLHSRSNNSRSIYEQPASQRNNIISYLLPLLIKYKIHRNFMNVGKDKNPRENHTRKSSTCISSSAGQNVLNEPVQRAVFSAHVTFYTSRYTRSTPKRKS